jgi:hypothetical protein
LKSNLGGLKHIRKHQDETVDTVGVSLVVINPTDLSWIMVEERLYAGGKKEFKKY